MTHLRTTAPYLLFTFSAGLRVASALPTTTEGGGSTRVYCPVSQLSAIPQISEGARHLQICASAFDAKVSLGLINLDRAFAKSSRLPSFRGGSTADAPHDRFSEPFLSVGTAWAASTLPAPSHQATKAVMESNHSKFLRQSELESVSFNKSTGFACALATIWAGWNFLNGALLTFAPKNDMSFVSYLVEAIGVVRMGQGMSLYLSTVLNVPVRLAMGFSLLARLSFLLKSFAMGTYGRLGAQKPPLFINTAIMGISTFCLLSGMGNPMLAANAFSTMAMLKASCLFFLPMLAVQRFFGIDISAEDFIKAKGKCRSLGFHLLISSVFMNALSLGVKPIKAAGVSSLTWLALLAELTFVSGKYSSFDNIPSEYLFFLSSALICSIVFLWQNGDQDSEPGQNSNSGKGTEAVWHHEEVPLRWDDKYSTEPLS